jgi:DUF4097 and DUF4098 domain-containing protein YvlB
MNLNRILCAAVVVILTATAVPAAGGEIIRDFNESFEVKQGHTLRLRHGDGDVTIIPWDKDIVEITVHYNAERKGFGDDSKLDFEVKFEEKNGVIEVTGRESKSSFMGLQIFILKEYTYTVSAPEYVELDLQGDDGNIEIEKWKGRIEIRLEDGDISLYGCEPKKTRIRADDGDISLDGHSGYLDLIAADGRLDIDRGKFKDCRIQLDDGDIRVRDSEGDFYIEVDDGDTELLRIKTKIMDLKSQDGDFDIELLKTDKLDFEVKTDDGGIDLSLQRGLSATFSIDVDDGRIRTDLPMAKDVQEGDNWMSGKLGSGQGKIRIRTTDGSVTLREMR